MAKIADLGMARIVPGLRASTMTKAPGASIYMPPEALEDKSRYNVTIDIFSLGVLAIFTLSQMFPDPLAAAYMDDSGRMVGRTELERRGNYMREVMRQFREGHPLVKMIQRCLKNRMRERPSIQQVMGWLEEARAEVQDGEYDVNKLSLAQLLHSRNQQQLQIEQLQQEIDQQQQQIDQQQQQIDQQQQQIDQQQQQIDQQQQQIDQQQQQIDQQQQQIDQQQQQIDQQQQQIDQQQQEICENDWENHSLREQNDVKDAQILSLEEQNRSLRAEKQVCQLISPI